MLYRADVPTQPMSDTLHAQGGSMLSEGRAGAEPHVAGSEVLRAFG
jgi:hypothetical protein